MEEIKRQIDSLMKTNSDLPVFTSPQAALFASFYSFLILSKTHPKKEITLEKIELTKSLSGEELVELIQYLASLKFTNELKCRVILALLEYLDEENIYAFADGLEYFKRKVSDVYAIIVKYGEQLAKIISPLARIKMFDQNLLEYPRLYIPLYEYYIDDDVDLALSYLIRVRHVKFEKKEQIQYLLKLASTYLLAGSKSAYTKCLCQVMLLGQLDVYQEIKAALSKKEFASIYQQVLASLGSDTDVELLHSILIHEEDIDNLIKYLHLWSDEMIIEDIQYFRLSNLEGAGRLYAEHILCKAKKMSRYKASIAVSHLKDLKRIYGEQIYASLLARLPKELDFLLYEEIKKQLKED